MRSACVKVNHVSQQLRLHPALNAPFQAVFLDLCDVTERGCPSGNLGHTPVAVRVEAPTPTV